MAERKGQTIVETPVEARGAERGPTVRNILVWSLGLMIVAMAVRIRPAPQAGAMVCRRALKQQRRPWTVGSPSNSREEDRRPCWQDDPEGGRARRQARLADRRRSSCRSRSGYRRRRHDDRQHLNRRRSNSFFRPLHLATLVRPRCS
jgi:hypothetical protein